MEPVTTLTIQQAIEQMGLSADDESGQRAVVKIPKGRKPIHAIASKQADRRVVDFPDDLYTTVAKYKEGHITEGGGRTTENCTSVEALVFDCDLKDYLNVSASVLHETPHDELDAMIGSLQRDAQEVFDRVGIPIHHIDCTGYGIAIYSRIHPSDRGRISDTDHVYKSLVERINGAYGGVLADVGAVPPSSRLTRLVGSFNHKGSTRRYVYTLFDRDGATRLDQFNIEPPKRRVSRRSATTPLLLTDETIDDLAASLANDYDEGKRNVICLGLPALFVKAGVSEDQCCAVIETVAEMTGDDELSNRLNAVERTYRKYEMGHSVSGYRMLLNLISPATRDYVDGKLKANRQALIEATAPPPVEAAQMWGNIYEPPPVECFYGWFSDYRDVMAPTTSGADSFHLISAMVYAGATIGRQAWVHHVGNHFPNLMAVLIGDSGTARKDTCAGKAQAAFNLQEKVLGTVHPIQYNILTDLSTPEGLVQYLHDSGARAVVHISEFNLLLGKSRREVGSGMLPMMTKLWDGLDHVDIPTRTKPLRVDNPYVSLLATVTPAILAQEARVDDIRSGFANRVIWVYGNGKADIPDPPEVDAYALNDLMREFLLNMRQVCAGGRQFPLSPKASKVWADWHHALSTRQFLNEDEMNLAVRLQPNAKKLALIFAVSDASPMIEEEHLHPAMAFMEWQFSHVRKESRMWGSNDDARLGEAVLTTLKYAPLTRSELYDRLSRFGAIQLERAIQGLRNMEKILDTPDAKIAVAARGGVA